VERAGFWLRAAAVALDLVAGGIFVLGGGFIVHVLMEVLDVSWPVADRVEEGAMTVLLLAYTSTEVWLGGTPGKLVLGMTIGTAAGAEADGWTLALRWSTKWYGYLLGLVHAVTHDAGSYFLASWMNTVVLVGCLQALDEDRRAWHDEWAGTAVLKRRKAAPVVPPPLPVA
jgi:uncharacterized RDD family membrane protein YckC